MKKVSIAIAFCCVLNISSYLAAQPEPAKIEKQHDWLKQFVGVWESNGEMPAVEGQPAGGSLKGTTSFRMIGELWLVSEMKMDMNGFSMRGLQTIGYDSKNQKYIGTWVDSVMNHMWHYTGKVDESGKRLDLEADGPDMMNPAKTAKYRDSYVFKSPDEIMTESFVMGPEGEWITFMTSTMTRKK